MAYADYANSVGRQIQPRQGQEQQYLARPQVQPRRTMVPGLDPGPMPEQQPQQPGTLPTNTRQDALQQVQQAYAGRMPGQMDALNSFLGSAAQPVGLNDPGIQPAIRAGAGADQRSFERQRAALAEIMGAQGMGDSGGFNTQVLGIGQRIGEQGAQRDANLVYNEMGDRRNALLAGLGMDQQRYSVDNDIGLRLASLEAMLNNQAVQPFF